MAVPVVSRSDVLRFRVRQQQLDREPGSAAGADDVDLLRIGVQDTGADGSAWALAVRGLADFDRGDLALAWTLRGAPHAYRRADLAAVAVASAPLSEADASKRIFDGAKPLRAAGIPALEALKLVAGHMREIVVKPTVKGDVSGALTERLGPEHLRACRPCGTTHIFEMPFRLSALQAGLELDPETSPPVLRRVARLRPPMFRHLAGDADPRFDVIRGCLGFYGPARMTDVAGFIDAPVKEVKAHWPEDAVQVGVGDEVPDGRSQPRFILADHLEALTAGAGSTGRTVRLVGPYDPYLQLRDRELLVGDEAQRKDLWRVLGRPGAILGDGEVLATWRPRASGRRLTVRIEPWGPMNPRDRRAVEEQAERLATHRGVDLAGVTED